MVPMAGSDSDILVCVYVATNQNLEGIYRTEDGGDSWAAIPTSSSNGLGSTIFGGFGWYFAQIRIHPVNDDWIYLLGVSSWFTSNNGNLWSPATNGSSTTPHVDHHDLVFNFQNDIILGNDGGAYKKESFSLNFSDFENIPATQVYRVAYNPHNPDEYYGGTQDNGTQRGNSIGINSWSSVLGGDGFQMRFHPNDENTVFAETQNGNIFRSTTGLSGFISSTTGISSGDRRHWDMQYFISPHNADRLYTGTYRVYRGVSAGSVSWTPISPDLTDGNIYGSPFHTISTLSESPLVEDLLYVGTTDGNVWRSENGGTTWDSLHMTLPNRYVTSLKGSPDLEDNVFVCLSGYRYNEFVPRVYKSTDRGDNWVSITGNLPDIAVNDIVILPNQNDQILFVATDAGIYATINGGVTWELLGIGMPLVTSYDMEWNEANNELIAGTFGRSIYTYPIDSLLNNLDQTIAVSGQVLSAFGAEGVDSVEVFLTGDVTQGDQTDAAGDYDLGTHGIGTECTITPLKNTNIRNGVSTVDLLSLQKHILFIDTLDSPYKILAGDVNNSNSLSTVDIVITRKVILFDQDTFLNTDSWRFVPTDYVFSDPEKPFEDNFPEYINCSDIQNGMSSNFIGFKVGDVTGNANPSLLIDQPDARNEKVIEFIIDNITLESGKTYRIPIYASESYKVAGFQLGLKLNDKVQFERLESGEIIDFKPYHYSYKKDGTLRISWTNPYSARIDNEEPLIYLVIKSLSDSNVSELMELKNEMLRAETYDDDGQIYEIEMNFIPIEEKQFTSAKVSPNPFKDQVMLSFNLLEKGEAKLLIFDVNGRLVYSTKDQFSAGINKIQLLSHQLNENGLYFYKIISETAQFEGKLLKQ